MSITLSNLKALRRWPEALELAIKTQPEEVEGLLEYAGEAFLTSGDYQKLHDLLNSLPETYQCNPETLFWRFRTAYRLQKNESLNELVYDYLLKHEAPNLRAFYASHYLKAPQKMAEIQRALAAKPSFFIKHLYALALSEENLDLAIVELEAICNLAKASGNHFDYQQSKNLLGYFHGSKGQFRTSLNCIRDALSAIRQNRQIDWQLYLATCNNLLYNQILVNDLNNAEDTVKVLSSNLDGMQTDIAFNARSTLGDYYLTIGNLAESLRYHQTNFEAYLNLNLVKNLMPGTLLLNYLKLLLKTNQKDKACDILQTQRDIIKDSSPDFLIAQALNTVSEEPKKVLEILANLEHDSLAADVQIVCLTLQVFVLLQLGDKAKANGLLTTRPITDLSLEGFRVLLASEVFDEVYNYWQGNDLLPILSDPRAFDELANDESNWHRLRLLKHFKGHIERCRYAQYLYSQNDFANALEIIKTVFETGPDLLSQSIYMSLLLSVGDIQGFETLLEVEIEEIPSLLGSEARMRMYEAISGYLYTHRNEPRLAQRHLYWEQAIAFELRLSRRQQIIAMLLEEVNTALGEAHILEPINHKGLKQTLEKQVRQRFDSILGECNLGAATDLFQSGYISMEDVKLVEALKYYRDAEQGQGSISSVARLLSQNQPDQKESKLYWALLMLQIYSKVGVINVHTELKFILNTLEQSASAIPNLDFLLPLTARLFPLGLALAAHLLKTFEPAYKFVFIVLDDSNRAGIYRGEEKLIRVPSLLREAIIRDGLRADFKAFQEAVSSKTGYTINKARFWERLEKVGLKDYELTNMGALFRGLKQVELDGFSTILSQEILQSHQHFNTIVPNL